MPKEQLMQCTLVAARGEGILHTMRTGHVGYPTSPILVCLVAKARVVFCQVCTKAHDLAIVHVCYARRDAPLLKLCCCHARAGGLLLLSLHAYPMCRSTNLGRQAR